ncbi:glycosyl hydrolase, partial [Streptomyces sp. Isolate_219]|nr:glycosyl hydrolase [Streptomyces sp. Isolate_219]
RRSVCAPGGPVFEAWAELTAQGARPALVLSELAADRAHLTSRGITEVCTPDDVGRAPRRPSPAVPHRRSTS